MTKNAPVRYSLQNMKKVDFLYCLPVAAVLLQALGCLSHSEKYASAILGAFFSGIAFALVIVLFLFLLKDFNDSDE